MLAKVSKKIKTEQNKTKSNKKKQIKIEQMKIKINIYLLIYDLNLLTLLV